MPPRNTATVSMPESPPQTSPHLPWWLVLLALGGVLTFLKVWLAPALPTKPRINFPPPPPLTGWTYVPGSQTHEVPPQKNPRSDDDFAERSQLYRYQRPSQTLTAMVRYYPGIGDVPSNVFYFQGIKREQLQRQERSPSNQFALYEWDNKAHLTACLTMNGATTVNRTDYMERRYQEDLNLGRFFGWALGQQSFWNHGCLWSLLALDTVPPASVAMQFQILETVWSEWRIWWQRYPQLIEYQPPSPKSGQHSPP